MTAWNVSHLRPSALTLDLRLINMLKFLPHVKEKKNDLFKRYIILHYFLIYRWTSITVKSQFYDMARGSKIISLNRDIVVMKLPI